MAEARLLERPEPLSPRRTLRVAVLSMHTSPLAPLGRGGNGGMNVYVRQVCRAFSERGIETDVFTLGDSESAGLLAPRSRVIAVPRADTRFEDKYALLEEVRAFAAAVMREARARPYDLLYSHYWLSGAAADLVQPELDIPWVHTAHTLAIVKNRSLASGATPEPQSRIDVERRIATTADLLVASTPAERNDLIELHGAPPNRVVVVPPGVDLARFRPVDSAAMPAPYLLFAGRLERLKGVEVALRALSLVSRDHPDVKLLIIGENSRDSAEDEKLRLQRVAQDLGLEDRVVFAGSVEHERLPAYYSGAAACLVPSYSESFGLVALEAQACGCPVIASDVPGLASIVRDGVTGFLVSSDSANEWAARLRPLLDNPELATQMGRRATLLAQRFSWTRTADRLLSAMTSLVARDQLGVQAGARTE